MYHLLRSQSLKQLLVSQAIPFIVAFTIAELFYKFKSFALETVAFLVTWFVLDLAFTLIRKALAPRSVPNLPEHTGQ